MSIDRKKRILSLLTTMTVLLGVSTPALSWGKEVQKSAPVQSTTNQTNQPTDKWFDLLPPNSITHHEITIGSKTIPYTAEAGTLLLRDEQGKPSAKIFYASYIQDASKDSKRPISFFFNGGPGAGSAFLNLGAAGPEVINFPKNNPTDGIHAQRVSNPNSWLPFTDMVFLDAVDTGFSLSADPSKASKQFYGVKQDATTFAKAIESWLNQSTRKDPPIWLVGESYGGLRSIKVAEALQSEQNILIHGIIMLSPAIEMGLLDQTNNPLANAFILPSYVAINLEQHHQWDPQKVEEAYHYALNNYLPHRMSPFSSKGEKEAFYKTISDKTGIPLDIVRKNRGILDPSAHDIRSRNGRLYSLYDGTLSIEDPYPEGVENSDSPEPVLAGFGRIYGNEFTNYAAQELHFKAPLTYNLLNMPLNAQWDYKDQGFSFVSGIAPLRKLLALNPSLQIFIAQGYFDLVCPFAISRWIAEQMPTGQDRITLKLYKGGHMLYTRPDSRAALTKDVDSFYQKNQ